MLGLCLAFWAAANPLPQLSSHTIDLRQWGYTAPPKASVKPGEYYPHSRLVTAYGNGNVVAGFVKREDEGLATRKRPALILHALTFERDGKFVSEAKFTTTMYDDNFLSVTAAGELLVRTPETLTLWSRERGVIAKTEISDPHTRVEVSPNREIILLRTPGQELKVLRTRDLALVDSCPYEEQMVASISDRNIAINLPYEYSEPHQFVRVATICGPTQFEFGWNFPTGRPILLDDTRFIINGGSALELDDREAVRWRVSFSKGESAGWQVEADEKGDVLAVAVSKYVGGSSMLDINGRLKVMKIVIYRAADGKRTAELVVEHPPRFVLYFFALSPEASVLAVLSDGFLQVAQLNP
jgi:hypothetical protein